MQDFGKSLLGLRSTLRGVRLKLCACEPDYFVDFDVTWFVEAQDYCHTAKYLKGLAHHIRAAPYIVLDVRKVQNDMRKKLNEQIPRLQRFNHHWQQWAVNMLSAEPSIENLPGGTLLLIVDFKQM